LDSMGYQEPQLEIANALVLQKPEGVLESYKSLLREDYDAEVFPGNVAEINSWCNEKTYGKIPEIIKELSPETVCVILNAVYFKGDWENPFNKEATRDMLFRLSGSESIQVPTMRQTKPFSTFRNDEFESILLPYKGDRVSMVIVMPPEGKSLDLLKRELTAEGFGNIWKNLSSAPKDKVFLTLPKFKIQSYYPLKKTFQAMGAVDPFGMRADFSKMSNIELLISEVLHKAVVEVDETGTVAAAVTAIIAVPKSAPMSPPAFKVDRPFMFFLVDNKTGTILFLARINDPRD
jgi:serpin B